MPPRLIEPVAPIDGRQSETALFVARGTRRLLRAKGFSSITEMTLHSGRRADIVAVSGDGTIHIIEVKSSIADFRTDTKWRDYRLHCDRLFFAIPPEVPIEIMPEDAGLIVADAYGAEIVRDASEHRLAAATRRVVLMRFAHTAAHRLHTLSDPQIAAMQPFS
ncbi:MmcB family DNA repair protein [Beijerinckia sp. L45]|uniref:MmcB family DNA repair protein n=1 Tax=Beijerinckia sp. L45 TaxID=1641855 RepID=UPI00131BDEAC|nr:MmcB family DNA repair protein [Beijerinckia sp. L45]